MMKNIPLNNQRLIKMLSDTIDCFYTDELKSIIKNFPALEDKIITDKHPYSEEYFYEAFQHKPLKDYGWPRAHLGVSGIHTSEEHYDKFSTIRRKVSRIGNFLGTPVNALIMAYPDDGYIGWHHNGNAPGFNVLMTYSEDGDGKFSYYDYETKEIKHLQDQPGWNARVGYYPNLYTHPDKVFWHAAITKKQRITLAWVINHKDMWTNMIEEITCGDYDKSVLNHE